MWIRITCPNGHPLENEVLEVAARSKRCPECQATVYMWTKVTCPNGHVLKVRTKHGGGTGNCPVCKASVEIPDFEVEAIMYLLLPKAAKSSPANAASPPLTLPPPLPPPPKKSMRRKYYLPSVKAAEIETGKMDCPYCGAVRFPGATVCTSCGRAPDE